MKRPVQYFTREYLERCKTMTPLEIIEFLEEFQELMSLSLEKSLKKDSNNNTEEKGLV